MTFSPREDALRDLKSLLEQGLISKEEYRERRRSLYQTPSSSPLPKGEGGDLFATGGREHSNPQKPFELSEGVLLMNRYHLGAKLGQGGMGQVFHCVDTLSKQEYALKFIREASGSNTPWLCHVLKMW